MKLVIMILNEICYIVMIEYIIGKKIDDMGENMANYDLIATAAMGLEAMVAKEVRELGYECAS